MNIKVLNSWEGKWVDPGIKRGWPCVLTDTGYMHLFQGRGFMKVQEILFQISGLLLWLWSASISRVGF